MATIKTVYAREILDSRGLPTVECSIWLDTGHMVTSAAAAGTSKGKYEALELRDKDANHMAGQGVLQAVQNVNQVIGPQLIGQDPTQQTKLDQILINLDGTPNKQKLGANAIIAVSQAVLKAGAASVNMPLYYYVQQKYQLVPTLNIPSAIYTMINGGEHGADNLDIQEFEIIPASHVDFVTSLNMAVTLYHKLEEVLITKGAIHSVGLVGGFTPNLFNNTDAFEILVETIKATPYTYAQDLFFGCDISADSIKEGSKYRLKDKSQPYTSQELHNYYKTLRNSYHVFYLEDPFDADDWDSWKKLTQELGPTSIIVGDSLLATNLERVDKAIKEAACNAVLVKPNQIGTISETIQVVQKAREAGWNVIISHRSGETADDFIADFGVGIGANYMKFGPPQRGERITKYNRLLQIAAELSQMEQPAPAAT
ncbi:MAG TPA: phosphopyruvate hydratase [Patescibacteria group bacterium]